MEQCLCRQVVCCAVVTFVCGTAAAQDQPLPTPSTSALVTTGAAAAAKAGADGETAPAGALTPGSASGFGWLIESSVADFGKLPSAETVSFLTVGGTAAFIAAMTADNGATHHLSRSSALAMTMDPGETIGGARMQLVGALATYGIGRVTGSTKVVAVGADLLRAQLLSQVVTAGIKMSVRRTRPDGTQFSFPSGHTSVTFASATVLHRDLGWKFGVPAYAVATYVAASRIQERRHFLSDVAFGATIGIIAGRTVTIGRGDARFAVAPSAVPGGAGVSFSWLGAQ